MKLFCHETGAGSPLVMLHGLLGSHHNLLPVAERLSAHFRVLLPDQRNHGISPHSVEMNYEVMMTDVAELIREREIPRACVLGHSMGGKVAMHLALAHPQLVEKLVVVDMSPREYPPRFDALLDVMLRLDLATFRRRQEIGDALGAVVPDAATRQFLLKNVAQDGDGRFRWRPNLTDIRANYPGLLSAVTADGTFDGPVLFVRGGESDFIRDEDSEQIRQLFPNASIGTIPGAKHWVHAEKAAEFVQVVDTFLKQSAANG